MRSLTLQVLVLLAFGVTLAAALARGDYDFCLTPRGELKMSTRANDQAENRV